jgi:hypothetical protein
MAVKREKSMGMEVGESIGNAHRKPSKAETQIAETQIADRCA